MRTYTEDSLVNFKFWSRAVDNAKKLTIDELEQLDSIFEELYPDGVDETKINDIFWFEFENICELLGLNYDSDNDKIQRH